MQLERPDTEAARSWAWDVADHAAATLAVREVLLGRALSGKLWSETNRRWSWR